MFRSKDITKYIPEISKSKRDLIIEVGANNGSDTLVFDSLVKDYTILAFEPDTRAYAKLTASCKSVSSIQLLSAGDTLFRTKNNNVIITAQKAVSSKVGEANFFASNSIFKNHENWDMSGSILEPHNHKKVHGWCKFEEPTLIKTTTLEAAIGEISEDMLEMPAIQFLWIDAQGAEKLVLEGLGNYIEFTNYIWTEYNNDEMYKGQPKRQELVDLLTGFEVLLDDGDNLLLKNKQLAK
jgi:2-O-methyltransferase